MSAYGEEDIMILKSKILRRLFSNLQESKLTIGDARMNFGEDLMQFYDIKRCELCLH